MLAEQERHVLGVRVGRLAHELHPVQLTTTQHIELHSLATSRILKCTSLYFILFIVLKTLILSTNRYVLVVVLGGESRVNVLERFGHVMSFGDVMREEAVRCGLVDAFRHELLAHRGQRCLGRNHARIRHVRCQRRLINRV